tara:strand:- start:3002 stop:4852 length:1851 start_codon:yes stop_codon:yes gene_type:complete
MAYTVFDTETNGLLDVLTKVHVLSYSHDGREIKHTHDYDEMRLFFSEAKVLVGHNICRFDIPAVEKVLGIKVKARLVDTLALSWYLNHERVKHGLEGYGEDYGVPKPVIKDWDSLTPEDYAHRCNEDVKINSRLWRDLDLKLNKLYQDQGEKDRLIDYLTFKMECAREQETLRWKLDVPRTQEAYDNILVLKEQKVEQLAEAMPKHILTRVATQPKNMTKKDGELSSHGEKWVALCKEYKQPVTSLSFVVKTGEERGNPNSSDQVKDWLYSLGWKPRTYKFVRDKKTGEERQIEQVRREGELCESVKGLSEIDPAVDLLDGLTVLTHRAGILKGFLDCVSDDGYLKAEIAGLTNTLRFKHAKPLVNLPGVDKPYGDVIRGVLTCEDGYVLAGADMTSLEDTTKRHYMKPLDPDYVEEMSREGFDPHLDLAKFAGVIDQNDIDKHNSGERSLKALRKNYKVVNYSATYGVGAPKLARETGMSVKEAKALLDAFWSRNWSVEAVARSLRVRELFGCMWLYNPVSKFWYALRSDKDRFSTLNQGTGVFCFDTWVAICRKNGVKTIGQFHDEVIALVEDEQQEEVKAIMHKAATKLNEKVKLNVPLGCDVQFGKTYGEIH